MIEKVGNIWLAGTDAICITTNRVVDKNGHAVMGAGIARTARTKYPELPKILGNYLRYSASNVSLLLSNCGKPNHIFSFSTKYDWRNKSDINLIRTSATELLDIINDLGEFYKINSVAIPRPGCGLGGLDWQKEVKPVLEKIFKDDPRFEFWSR